MTTIERTADHDAPSGAPRDTVDITVVVPTYNRCELLPRLVRALEGQTLPPDRFEVVVVDNASSDATPRVLDSLIASSTLAIRRVVEPRPGPAAARNAGWKRARSELIAFIDDDCEPQPGWLEAGLRALQTDERVGVVQGCVQKREEDPLGDWTLWRHVSGPTPYFEGLNIFYRRRALVVAGGFDEVIGNYGEDAALGWSVLDGGWQRAYAPDAVAYHDVEERGLRYHLRTGLLERNVARVARAHPGFRRDAFWRPWAFRRENAAFTVAVAALVLATRWRPAALLVLPYLRLRLPAREHPRRARYLLECVAVDAARFAGMRYGSLRYRIAVL